jgi:hypothetical protein
MKKIILLTIIATCISLTFSSCGNSPSGSPDKKFTENGVEKVVISPTWGQAFHYANEAGQRGWTVFGIILIVIAGVVVYLVKTDRLLFLGNKGGVAVNIGLFVLLASAMASIGSKPGSVKWNNDKIVDKAHYEKVGAKYLWDSLEKNCLIIDGPYNCYK